MTSGSPQAVSLAAAVAKAFQVDESPEKLIGRKIFWSFKEETKSGEGRSAEVLGTIDGFGYFERIRSLEVASSFMPLDHGLFFDIDARKWYLLCTANQQVTWLDRCELLPS